MRKEDTEAPRARKSERRLAAPVRGVGQGKLGGRRDVESRNRRADEHTRDSKDPAASLCACRSIRPLSQVVEAVRNCGKTFVEFLPQPRDLAIVLRQHFVAPRMRGRCQERAM